MNLGPQAADVNPGARACRARLPRIDWCPKADESDNCERRLGYVRFA